MTPSDLAKVAAKFGVSKSVAALSLDPDAAAEPVAAESKRVRQDEGAGPKVNNLEAEWMAVLRVEHPGVELRAQAKRYRIGNGSWYKPDITAVMGGREVAWECKGPKEMRGVAKGVLVLKAAAAAWPEVEFWLVWRKGGMWKKQRIFS